MTNASFYFESQAEHCRLHLCGDWQLGNTPNGETLCEAIPSECHSIIVQTSELGTWDSSLAMALLPLSDFCTAQKIDFNRSQIPEGLQQLLSLATAIPRHQTNSINVNNGIEFKLKQSLKSVNKEVSDTFIFIGSATLAFKRWLTGTAKTRHSDLLFFIEQAGPKALPIVTLISLSVGMILAYLGSVQLRQLGAQVYVANLVSIGMVREMGALMSAIIIAGRTGAAYAAQLGTMQVNEEIDALKTMGISNMEFLVLPRLLALVVIMPLLCIYADVIGMIGGALVASGMDVSFSQYILQTQAAVDWLDIFTGLYKSIVFGILIAIAGCQAGLACGRSSTAVGVATTNAVVRAIVFLIIADAAFNVLFDKMGI